MGRTDWGGVIIGGAVLVTVAYVFFNWKTVCPQVFGASSSACTGGGVPGLFGGTITGSGIAQGYGQILTSTNPTTGKTSSQVINPSNVTAGIGQGPKVGVTLGKPTSKPKLNATGSVGAGVGAGRRSNYTDFHSFNTITLNRLSVR